MGRERRESNGPAMVISTADGFRDCLFTDILYVYAYIPGVVRSTNILLLSALNRAAEGRLRFSPFRDGRSAAPDGVGTCWLPIVQPDSFPANPCFRCNRPTIYQQVLSNEAARTHEVYVESSTSRRICALKLSPRPTLPVVFS